MSVRYRMIAAALTLGVSFSATPALAQSCGESYTIRSGDTLSEIAARVYGDPQRWSEIHTHASNFQVIGQNANRIQVGDRIAIPTCPGDRPPVIGQSGSGQRTDRSGGYRETIWLLTGNAYEPFSDEKWPENGLATQVVRAAFENADVDVDYRVDFVNDWGSHLDLLLKERKFDMGFPWLKPNCDALADKEINEDTRRRCEEYTWSDPIYSFSVVLFAPTGMSNPPAEFRQLKGKRLCRPVGYYTFDLLEKGLVDGDNITLVQPNSPIDCFELLDRGEVDFVTFNRFTGQVALVEAGLDGVIEPLMSLVDARTLHLVAHNNYDKPAQLWMRAFNRGLAKLRESRDYDRIVAYHLDEFQRRLSDR